MNNSVNALSARDALFSELHVSVLKPAGFRKRGHWATRTEADTIQSVYLRASRFGSRDKSCLDAKKMREITCKWQNGMRLMKTICNGC